MRLFVAIEVPASWRDAAVAAQRALAASVPPGTLRAVDPRLLHLTLRFLGEVDAEGPDDGALPALRRELDAVAPIDVELALGAAGGFGAPRSTRVAWLAVDGNRDGLDALAARVERAVTAAGLPPEPRPLRPHLTLARVSRHADADARRATAEAIARLPASTAPPFRAREIELLRSHLGTRGPRYERLSRHG